MNKLLIFFTTICLASQAPSCWSQALNEAPAPVTGLLQDMLDTYRANNEIIGMALGAHSTKDPSQPFYRVYSGTTLNHGTEPVKEENLFAIGSMTKGFTAVLLLRLQEDPRYQFNLDQPIHHWLPHYQLWGNITIRQLLNQTSGITYGPGYKRYKASLGPGMQASPKDLLNHVKEDPLGYETGKGWYYCNTNYIVAGEVYEAVTHRSIKEGLEEMVRQFGLKNTYFIKGKISDDLHAKMVHGYEAPDEYGNRLDYTGIDFDWAGAAGAMVSNVADLTLWYSQLYAGQNILKPESLQQMQATVCMSENHQIGCDYAGKPLPLNSPVQGYGLGVVHFGSIWWHNGSVPGYFSYYLYNSQWQSLAVSLADSHKLKEDLFGMTYNAAMAAWVNS